MGSGAGLLCRAVEAVERGADGEARALLDGLRAEIGPEPRGQDTIFLFYLAGLAGRLDGVDGANLYLRRFDEAAQIDLFGLLVDHLPFMGAGRVANDRLLRALGGAAEASLVSFGIGKGVQEAALVERAGELGLPLRRLTVIGADPAGESLEEAGARLRSTAVRHGVELVFQPVEAVTERFPEEGWRTVADAPRPLVAAASYALHHMVDPVPGLDARGEFLRRLRSLDPVAFALVEPDSDHHHVPLGVRFRNSWRMFSTLFAAIDELPVDPVAKDAMRSFFGREIIDIVGSRDEDRYERHEPPAAWLARLRRCGFRPEPFPGQDHVIGPGHTVHPLPDRLEYRFRGTPLLAVITAVPDGNA